MPEISPILRRRIGTVAYELDAVGRDLRPQLPGVADIFHSISSGIEPKALDGSSQYSISFVLPHGCLILTQGEVLKSFDGPVTLKFR